VDVLAAPPPRPDAVLEPRQRGVLGRTAGHERPEAVQGAEPVVARPGAYGRLAIIPDEVNMPGIDVMLEIEEETGHGRSIGVDDPTVIHRLLTLLPLLRPTSLRRCRNPRSSFRG
jgi:hypothetical protein